ncbi:MAG: carotenoid biosynthesis protein [Polyangiaceae bacterium]
MSPASLAIIRRAYEAGLPLLCAISAFRSWRARGARVTAREILFGFALSQSVELLAVAQGRYRYPDWVAYFPPSPKWVPLGIGLGWAALVPVVMRISEALLGPSSRSRLALCDGALAVGLDLMLDPAVSGEPIHMWVWRGEGMTPYRLWVLDVPVFNFVGWFLLIGACGFQLRASEAKGFGSAPWKWLGAYLAMDLLVAYLVMRLPW